MKLCEFRQINVALSHSLSQDMGFPDQFPDVNSLEPRNRTDQTSIWSLALLKTQQPSVSIHCHLISLMARYIALMTIKQTQ